jgi:hypothetical protein
MKMFKRPFICAVNQQSIASNQIRSNDVFGNLGSNSGNIMFSEALYRRIKGAQRGSYTFTQNELGDADCIVLASANWLNSKDDFGWLADILEQNELPVVAVGLGAQSDFYGIHPKLPQGTIRLIKLISERSKAISVRGDFSADVLAQHGIHNVMITGCPSALLINKPYAFINRSSILHDGDVAIHGSRNLNDAGRPLERYLYRQAISRNISMVLQSELPEINQKLNVEIEQSQRNFQDQVLSWAYGTDADTTRRFIDQQGYFFSDLESWIEFLSKKKFSFGTRLHCTIAALIAGTPATLVAHDSRTIETALAMHLPFVDARKIDLDRPLNFQEHYDDAAISLFEKHYPIYLKNFRFFFNISGLELNPNP